jgi:peptidoglycan/xylan/chitin deacetylase (PgdA/CDA1 family)
MPRLGALTVAALLVSSLILPAQGQAQSSAGAATPPKSPARAAAPARPAAAAARVPNELGRIPILEYHLIGEPDSRWRRSPAGFRRDLELLWARGYRPVTVADLVDKRLDLPAGLSPVVITFDDASPGQFAYRVRDGVREVDPASGIGIWLDFARAHPDWGMRATFCLLSNADQGHAFFGNKGIAGQETAWRFPKLQWLVAQGFELCNHTLYHVRLDRAEPATVRAQLGGAQLAIDSAVPGYRVRTFALPLGIWPKERAVVYDGTWTDKRSGRAVTWRHDAVLEVADTKAAGAFSFSPHDERFDPRSLPRVQVIGDNLAKVLDRLEPRRYVSDGDPAKVAGRASP